jgi:hypothetical protein
MRKKDANKMGRMAERAAKRKYRIQLERDNWHDFRWRGNGSPGDVKAAKYRKGQRYGRFMLWKGQHQEIRSRNGGYIFAVVGEGNSGNLRVLKLQKMGARELERKVGGLSWYKMANKKDTHGTKVPWPKVVSYGDRPSRRG